MSVSSGCCEEFQQLDQSTLQYIFSAGWRQSNGKSVVYLVEVRSVPEPGPDPSRYSTALYILGCVHTLSTGIESWNGIAG
jgi:hypothetical protein